MSAIHLHIKPTFLQCSGWQKAQIEKRRKEQLKQRKQHLIKKLEDFKVDTCAPADCTTTGLRLKMGRQPAKDIGPAKQIVQHRRPWQINQVSEPLPINPVRRPQKITNTDASTNRQVPKSTSLEVKEKLKTLSISSGAANANGKQIGKRKSMIPMFTGQYGSKAIQSDEGKENGAFSQPSNNVSRVSQLTKKHLQLATDLASLKQEHANALQLLQELDKQENRRRSLGSASSTYTLDSDETSERDIFEKANRGGGYPGEYDYGELVSSGEMEQQPPIAVPDESFAWLPEGIQDASHLSIVLNEDIESQEEEAENSTPELFSEQVNTENEVLDGATSNDDPSEQVEEDSESLVDETHVDGSDFSSSQSDGYLSDTSGY